MRTYFINASSVAVTLTFDISLADFYEGQLFFIKAIDVTNTVRVAASGCTIDGSGLLVISTLNDGIEIQFYDGNFYIVSNKNTSGGGSGLTHGEVMGRVDLGF